MKLINLLFFFFPIYSFSQVADSGKDAKWVNYKRVRMEGENNLKYFEDKLYVTQDGDTLVRSFTKSKATNAVICESSFLHSKKNGLEIVYFPNGVIESINYFLEGKLWETISRADSNGMLLNPGTLHDGNGTKFFTDYHHLNSNCYQTYKNGLPKGPFFETTGNTSAVQGELTYEQSAVNYWPAKKITFLDNTGKKDSMTFRDELFKEIIDNLRSDSSRKILSILNDSVADDPRDFVDLSIGFSDPAIIPKGNWKIINTKSGKTVKSVDFDDNGNAVKVVAYKEDGGVFWQREYSPCNKRKIPKFKEDGSFGGEFCRISK